MRYRLLIALILIGLIASKAALGTTAYFGDSNQNAGNTFEAWVNNIWTQTTQADFEAGVPNSVDTSSSPDDVKLTSSTLSNWYNTSWQYRRVITIDHTKVDDVADPSTTYANFPVLVYAAGLSNVNAGGTDIRFTSSDGTTELPREIESYSAGTLYAWAKVTLTKDASDSTDDIIYMYYGNAAASEPAPDSTYGSQNVWDANYKGVWHLSETSGAHVDSTANNNNGTPNGGVIQTAIGEIDGADDFDGIDDYIQTTSNELQTAAAITISAWFKADVTTDARHIVWEGRGTENGWGAGASGHHEMHINVGAYDQSNILGCFYGTNEDALSPNVVRIDTAFSDTTNFHHTVFVVTNPGSSPAGELFLDGVSVGTDTGDQTDRSNWDTSFRIGQPGTNARYFDGMVDEVRISDIARGAEWLKTEYNNQNNPSTFCGVGSEEGQSNWYDSNWQYRRAITFSAATSMANYQVLVTLTTAMMGNPYANVKSDGSDIRFTGPDGTTIQDYWVESWDNTGTSKIWVEVATSGISTIYMYYGNATASSASDGKATFDFFDGFEEHAIGEDPDGWTDQGTEDFYVALHGSEKWFQVNTCDNWTDGSTATGMANIGDAVWSARIYYHQSGTNAWGGIGVHIGNGNIGRIVVIRDGGWYRANEPDWSGGSGWQANADIHFPLGTKGRIELVTNGTNLDAYWNNPPGYSPEKVTVFTGFTIPAGTGKLDVHVERPIVGNTRWIDADDIIVRKYANPEPTTSVGAEEAVNYVSSGTITSQVLDTGVDGVTWYRLSWVETLESGTDITFEVRASDTAFLKGDAAPSWTSVGGTSPVTSGLPLGRYMQWRATLTTSNPAETPTLHEVTVEYY